MYHIDIVLHQWLHLGSSLWSRWIQVTASTLSSPTLVFVLIHIVHQKLPPPPEPPPVLTWILAVTNLGWKVLLPGKPSALPWLLRLFLFSISTWSRWVYLIFVISFTCTQVCRWVQVVRSRRKVEKQTNIYLFHRQGWDDGTAAPFYLNLVGDRDDDETDVGKVKHFQIDRILIRGWHFTILNAFGPCSRSFSSFFKCIPSHSCTFIIDGKKYVWFINRWEDALECVLV